MMVQDTFMPADNMYDAPLRQQHSHVLRDSPSTGAQDACWFQIGIKLLAGCTAG
jgi:hypothetical protein